MILETMLVVFGAGVPLLFVRGPTDKTLRERLLGLVQRRPGVRLSTLWKDAQISRGTAQYHLEILEEAKEVEAIREGKNLTRYFPKGVAPGELVLLSLLLRGRILDVVRVIQGQPGISQHEITERLGLSRKVFRSYANQLLREHMLREIRESNVKRYFPTDRLRETMVRVDDQEPPTQVRGFLEPERGAP